jgi:hypothetical protein
LNLAHNGNAVLGRGVSARANAAPNGGYVVSAKSGEVVDFIVVPRGGIEPPTP